MDREHCIRFDQADPLSACRDRFRLPAGIIYLDGNSLGALPAAVPGRLARAAEMEWGEGLIRSWNAAGWIDLPRRLGARLAPLIGAAADEVVVADSTSVNLFKLLAGALPLRPGRRTILSEAGNFPTDLYIAEGLCRLTGGYELRLVADGGDLAGAIDDRVALVMATHVDYRSGRMHDLPAVTRAAHDAGALMLWDLAHTAGAMPVDLSGAGVDLAVGCGYKYLNGGPGAPAFLYVRRDLQAHLQPVLSGWMGHAEPFAFEPGYRPAGDLARALCGTPVVLGMTALEAALEVWDGIDLAQVRAKSQALGDLFITVVESRAAGLGLTLASPRDAGQRGSQVSFRHRDGYAVVQALIAEGIIGDFRSPDIMRFGFAPLYLRHVDVYDAAVRLSEILATGSWDRPEFRRRAAVT